VDGYINASSVLTAEIAKSNLPFKLVGDPISNDQVAFPFAKNKKGEKLLKEFNDELKKLRENGELKEISEKYYKKDFTSK
ncbi:transporter substrate-binding domain-containing protein, partial [Priestia megaterium]